MSAESIWEITRFSLIKKELFRINLDRKAQMGNVYKGEQMQLSGEKKEKQQKKKKDKKVVQVPRSVATVLL